MRPLDVIEVMYDFDAGEVVSVEQRSDGWLAITVLSRNANGQHWTDPNTGELATHVVDRRRIH